MAIEPPLKKRKHYDAEAGNSAKDSGGAAAAASESSSPPASAPAVLTEEQKLRKKKNRDEIGSFYKLYRRLKFCLDRKRTVGSTATPSQDLEEAYCSILKLSLGCSSVQRIAAELIPRYAKFCPSAIDLASNALIQILEWSEDLVFQDEDFDGVAFETVKACLAGMLELSSAAVAAPSEVPEISDMSTAVCHNIAYYLLCRLEGRDLINCNPAENIPAFLEDDSSMQDRLLTLVSYNLVRLFYLHPQSVFAACFEFLSSTNEKQRKEGQIFLRQIIDDNSSEIQNSKDVPMLEGEDASCMAAVAVGDLCNKGSPLSSAFQQKKVSDCLVMQVLHSKPILERWLVSTFRQFCRSASTEVVSESLPLLTALIQSLSSFTPSDLDPDYEEPQEVSEKETAVEEQSTEKEPQDIENEENVANSSLDVKDSPHYEDAHFTNEAAPFTNMESEDAKILPEVSEKLRVEDIGEVVEANLEGNINSSSDCVLHTHNELHESKVIASHDTGSDLTKISGNDVRSHDAEHKVTGSANHSSDVKAEESPSSRAVHKHAARCSNVDDVNQGPGSEENVMAKPWSLHSGDYPNDTSGPAAGSILSPRHFSALRFPDSSLGQSQVTWYSDGDPAALDVFAASKQLWVGSLGHGVTENLMRYEFEKFGVIESFSLFPGQDFGLVEYRSIVDAVRAREVLQGATLWSMPLKIKFLDVGLGSRGTIGGVAVGGSCHVYIGSVFSLNAKEEIMKDIARACLKGPRTFCFLPSANALLLEFDAPEEAAAAMLHVRQCRREKSLISTQLKFPGEDVDSNQHLWSPEVACVKTQLNGLSFEKQGIQTDYRSNSSKAGIVSSVSSPHSSVLYPTPSSSSSWQDLRSPLVFPPGASSGKNTSSTLGYRTKGLRGGRDLERVPTNTLWVGLSDNAIHAFPSDTELRTIFNLACKGVGLVTRMSSVRSSKGSCRFVEFDCVDAAASALDNCAGYLDPGIQVEFSNSTLSLQQNEFSYSTSNYQIEDLRSVWDKEKEWDKGLRSPAQSGLDDARLGFSHGQTGWAQARSGVAVDETSKYRGDRFSHYESMPRTRDGIFKMDSVMGRFSSMGSFRIGESSSMDSPNMSQGSNHSWLGNTPRPPDHHSSLVGSLGSAVPPAPSVSPLPMLKHLPPPRVHLDRLSSTGTWMSSSQTDSISSGASSVMNISLPGICNSGPVLPSPVTPSLPRYTVGITNSFDQLNPPLPPLPPISPPPPPPPLETPPPPISPPPPLPFHVTPVPPASASLPSVLMERQSQVMFNSMKKDGPSNSNQQHWRGSLCKSGFQYCEVLAYSQDSAVCLSEAFHEPMDWPTKLDVTKRADFRSVRYSFQNTAASQRQVCRLSVCPGSINQDGFKHFDAYLRQRDRAGVVMIPETRKLKARVLFILPWSHEVCDLFAIPHQPSDNLIGLVLPMETAFN